MIGHHVSHGGYNAQVRPPCTLSASYKILYINLQNPDRAKAGDLHWPSELGCAALRAPPALDILTRFKRAPAILTAARIPPPAPAGQPF